jgi:hypothetical protein
MRASTALRLRTPQKSFLTPNRFAPLRDASPVPIGRERSGSVKRKEPEGPSFASVAAGNNVLPPVINLPSGDLSNLTLDVATVSSLVEKAAKDVNDVDMDPAVVSVFSTICEAMRGICRVQDKIVTASFKSVGQAQSPAPDFAGPAPQMVSLGAISKKPRGQVSLSQPVVSSHNGENNTDTAQNKQVQKSAPAATASVPSRVPVPEPAPAIKRFRDAIRDAERSTLVLNLNMGRIPIVNKETLAKKATLALTAAAAKKESETEKVVKTTPSPDAVAAIDDVLSIVKNYSFYGSGTKTYKNPKDELSGSYCTAPVKYEFKDKETRTAAEKILKSTCGISCTTPYPAMVRECIKQIIDDVKKEYPDNFIRVTVDTGKMVFKVARKPPKNAQDNAWKYGKVDIPIPEAALDISRRWAPKDFKLEVPVLDPLPVATNSNNQNRTPQRRTDSSSSIEEDV